MADLTRPYDSLADLPTNAPLPADRGWRADYPGTWPLHHGPAGRPGAADLTGGTYSDDNVNQTPYGPTYGDAGSATAAAGYHVGPAAAYALSAFFIDASNSFTWDWVARTSWLAPGDRVDGEGPGVHLTQEKYGDSRLRIVGQSGAVLYDDVIGTQRVTWFGLGPYYQVVDFIRVTYDAASQSITVGPRPDTAPLQTPPVTVTGPDIPAGEWLTFACTRIGADRPFDQVWEPFDGWALWPLDDPITPPPAPDRPMLALRWFQRDDDLGVGGGARAWGATSVQSGTTRQFGSGVYR